MDKLDAKQSEPEIEEFNYPELLQDVVMKFKKQAEEKDIQLTDEIESAIPLLEADIGMLERALSNLIDNALQHTPKGGSVRVRLEKIENKVRTSISDSGPGISPEDKPFIFDRYYRGNKNSRAKGTSTGLGLPIALKIVELYASTIKVISTPGSGATFYFDLDTSISKNRF